MTQPELIVQGQEDALVPVVNAINMSKSLPNARLIVYPDAGHAAFSNIMTTSFGKLLNF
ncbi:alpha/beta fold hydrolase [Mucilaginibacter lappiensis]|uniref:alpha/beta fold hydrolase n=1 Tax=Mucilaginibacter lappiensis TaxID=354630 RepID=UPI003D208231